MTPRPRVVNVIGIRVDHHCQYLLFASLKYVRVKLSVMCVLLCIQLWAIITSRNFNICQNQTRSPFRLVAGVRCHKFILTILYGTTSYRAWLLLRVYTYLSTSVLIAFLAIALQRMFLVSDTYTRLSTAINVMSIIYLFDEKQVLRVCFL